MQFRPLKNWKNPQECEGLIFVAQMIDELVFKYTLSTYKPSAMNTSLLVKEGLDVINLINEGVIKESNLESIIEELTANLKSDIVAKDLIKVSIGDIISELKSKGSLNSKKTILELLDQQINLHLYKDKTEELLIEHLNLPTNFSILRQLTRTYITTLINVGFSESFIDETSREFFFKNSHYRR